MSAETAKEKEALVRLGILSKKIDRLRDLTSDISNELTDLQITLIHGAKFLSLPKERK